MLASINPLGERARRQHYVITVSAFIATSTLAGALLGAILGFVGRGFSDASAALASIAGLALLGLALDAGVFGWRVPGPRRQVEESWLSTYRGWVYGTGFGAQLGVGFTTIVTASATWVAFTCALLAGSPLGGLLVGATYGAVRALPVLMAARIHEPGALRSLVRSLEVWRPRLAAATIAVQSAIVIAALALAARIGRVVMQLAAHGLSVTLRAGWEGRILRRRPVDVDPGAVGDTYTVMHLASFPLPEQRGDFGAGVTELIRSPDVLVVLFEYGPESLGSPMFAAPGIPRLRADMFSSTRLQRPLPGQLGCQLFFTEGNRPFCLYVVAGSRAHLPRIISEVNVVLEGLEIVL